MRISKNLGGTWDCLYVQNNRSPFISWYRASYTFRLPPQTNKATIRLTIGYVYHWHRNHAG